VFPEEVEPYLNAKAALETNLKVDRVDDVLPRLHSKCLHYIAQGRERFVDVSGFRQTGTLCFRLLHTLRPCACECGRNSSSAAVVQQQCRAKNIHMMHGIVRARAGVA